MPATRHLDIVPEPEDEDAEAAAQLRAALISARERARREVARVVFPRITDIPQCDTDGHYLREDGKVTLGNLVLYFRRLNPETLESLRAEHTRRTPLRRGGTMTYEERLDENAFGEAWIYQSLLPWCRQRYFEDQSLWGDEPVGTGAEYFQRYLTQSERMACLNALGQLEHADDNQAELLGKDSASQDLPSS